MQTIKQSILKYLQGNDAWVWGGKIDDHIRSIHGAKASNSSRRCRELENEGKLEVRRVQVDGKGPYVTQYRIKRVAPVYTNPKQLAFL